VIFADAVLQRSHMQHSNHRP